MDAIGVFGVVRVTWSGFTARHAIFSQHMPNGQLYYDASTAVSSLQKSKVEDERQEKELP